MKTNLLTLLFLIVGYSSIAQGIHFDSDSNWQQLKGRAQKENKYILIDTYATWCVPCKEMEVNTFRDQVVGDYFNGRFLAMKIQVDRTKDDSQKIKSQYADAKLIAETYDVNEFPTILIFNQSAELIGKILGFRNPKEFIGETQKIVSRNDAFEKNYQMYLEGKQDSSFVKTLVNEAKQVGRLKLAHSIAQKYINELQTDELYLQQNLSFVHMNTTESTDRGFRIFRDNPVHTDSILNYKYRNPSKSLTNHIIYSEEIKPYFNGKTTDWEGIQKRLTKKYGKVDKEWYAGIRMNYALENELWEDFGKYYAIYYKTAFNHSKYHINNFSWYVFAHVTDKAVLETAVKTQKYNVDHYDTSNAGSWDTYANLLYKIGRRNEALDAEKRAIYLSQSQKSYVETLRKMEAGVKTWE